MSVDPSAPDDPLAVDDADLRDLLVRASLSLSKSLDVEHTLATLSQLVLPQFADWYAVHLVNEQGELVPLHISHANPDHARRAWEASGDWPESVDGRSGPAIAVRTGRSLLTANVDSAALAQVAQNDEHLRLLKNADISSAMVTPLTVEGRTIGAMTFLATESRRRYREGDLRVAEALASRAALALANARLHQQVTEARERAEAAARRLAILVAASESIALSLTPAEALARLAQFVTPALADYCVTYLLEADGTIVRVGLSHADAVNQDLVEALVRTGPPLLENAHGVGAVIRTGQPVLVKQISDSVLQAAAQNAEHLAVLQRLKPRSSIIVPLNARGRTLGGAAFATTDHSGRHYDQADLALAEDLAGRMALLIDNARLYDQAQSTNQAMEDMLSVVAHDLRNPLNTIVTSAALLNADVQPNGRQMAVRSISRAADRMARLLDDLQDVTRIGQRRLSIDPVSTDLAALADEVVATQTPVAQARGIRLACRARPAPLTADVDPERVIQALSNLLDNALKFTPPGGEVRVSVDAVDGAARVEVADQGPGVSPEEMPRLFERFWRSPTVGHDGLGLGLAIAKGIVDAHGGRLDVSSDPGRGATFALVLPLNQGGRP